ncbi:MAG: CDP-archaeol synthase [Chromatiales bacterium]|jgi:CDP-2,3-bis-(O-geranylgeranyl)-sn-glycerol synthase|nr:CDP-archaeol synthase [Chromatiales bacterium]
MAELHPALETLLLVIMANLAPWVLARLLRGRWAAPLDGGLVLADGERLLGAHKTWRGAIAGSAACAAVAATLGYGWRLGALFGLLALTGDALSSCVKRRLRRRPGTEVPGLDQLPEVLLPCVVLARPLGLSLGAIAAVAAAFYVLNVAATGIRQS